jgi:hypothetical protein
MLGVTNGEPVPIDEPPLATSYHVRVPVQFDAVKLRVPGPQRDTPPAVGAIGIVFTVPVTCVLGLIHPFASVQLTQKLVVEARFGEYVGPVLTNVPPDDALYQLRVPPTQPLADKLTTPGPHSEPLVTVGAAGIGLTVTTKGGDVAEHPFTVTDTVYVPACVAV